MKTKRISVAVLLVLLTVILPSAIFAAPGDLDLSFGQNGVVDTAIGTNGDYAQGVAIQIDGKIIAVGAMTVNQGTPVLRATIVRYKFEFQRHRAELRLSILIPN